MLAIFATLADKSSINFHDFFTTSSDLVTTILSSLAGSLLAVTTFTFSTILVVLTMYASNFSPRIIETFLSKKLTMEVLGVFIGGVFYCVITLSFIATGEVIVGKIAILYFFISIFYFVRFIYSVAKSMQTYTIIEENFEIAKKA